jgi:hypothetical protein
MDGMGFHEVLGAVMADDLSKEAARVESDRRARMALRKQYDAIKGTKSLSASEMLGAVLEEGKKIANEFNPSLRSPEVKHGQPELPPVVASFPPPPPHR